MADMRAKDAVAHVEEGHQQDYLEKSDDYAPDDIQKAARQLEDPEWIKAQRRYLWKLDSIILPAISVLYFFEYLDRGNVAVRFPALGSSDLLFDTG